MNSLSGPGAVVVLVVVGGEALIHAPQRPVERVRRREVLDDLQVVEVHPVEDGRNHRGPVGFDLRQQRFGPERRTE